MISRSLCVLLLAASVAGFDYFVTTNKGEGVCVSNEREWAWKELVPLYDLDEREQKWTDGWRLRSLETYAGSSYQIYLNHRIVTTNGSEQFKSIVKRDSFNQPELLVLASEATLLWSENENWREGRSFRVHLNQPHPEMGNKATWAEFCTKPEKCERMETSEDNTGGADVLLEGRRWTYLGLEWDNHNLTLVAESDRTLVKWSLKNIGWFDPEFPFARTESTRGVFFVPLYTQVDLILGQSKNELSRTFSVGPGGKLCIYIKWWGFSGDLGRFELLDSSGVVDEGRLVAGNWKTRLNFDLGRAGNFTLRLIDVKKNIRHIGACADNFKVWSPSSGCYVYEGNKAFSDPPTAKLYSAQLNASLQVDLTKKQMRKVCDALKVQPGDPALRFNSKRGAAFVECPSPEKQTKSTSAEVEKSL